MKKEQLRSDLALLVITLIWGATFIAVKKAIEDIPVFNFLAIRFFIAFIALAIIFYKYTFKVDYKTLFYSFIVGASLFLAYAFQTLGLMYTTASKSGFITGFSVILVPVFEFFILNKKSNKFTIYGTIIAFLGLGFLSIDLNSLKNMSFNIGDIYTMICAFFFSMQIILISIFNKYIKAIPFAIYQIGTVAVLSTIATFIWEKPVIPKNIFTWEALLITGLLATAIAFTVQTAVQKYTTAAHTALIFTAEPIFSAVFAYILAGETMTTQNSIGAVLILAGMLLSEL